LKEAEKDFYFRNGRYVTHCRACQSQMMTDKRVRDGLPPKKEAAAV
jgi:hypothetical protein